MDKFERKLDDKFSIRFENYSLDIIKTSNGEPIPADEPLFLLRARDHLALPLLKIYRELSRIDGCNDYHFKKLKEAISAFRKFKQEKPEKMKQPSITRGL